MFSLKLKLYRFKNQILQEKKEIIHKKRHYGEFWSWSVEKKKWLTRLNKHAISDKF